VAQFEEKNWNYLIFSIENVPHSFPRNSVPYFKWIQIQIRPIFALINQKSVRIGDKNALSWSEFFGKNICWRANFSFSLSIFFVSNLSPHILLSAFLSVWVKWVAYKGFAKNSVLNCTLVCLGKKCKQTIFHLHSNKGTK
jgi:hypothetical protein